MSDKLMYQVKYEDGEAIPVVKPLDEEFGLEGKYFESSPFYATELEAWQVFGRHMARKLDQRESTLDEIRGLIT